MYRLLFVLILIIVVLTSVLVLSRQALLGKKSLVKLTVTPTKVPQVTVKPSGVPVVSTSSINVSGTVQDVSGNIISISAPPIDTSSTASQEYNVVISSATVISRRPIVIPYLTKENHEEPIQKATAADIAKGDFIEIGTKTTLSAKEIVAESIKLSRVPYVIEGLIQSKTATQIVVDAVPVLERIQPNGQPPQHASYTVKISPETEISRQSDAKPDGTGGEVKKYTLTDLTENTRVVIYASVDVTKYSTITAARIEPVL